MELIPKIIHCCWFGSKPIPEKESNCIKSWKKFLPDYEIRIWNEKNFNLNDCLFVQQAYEAKKYAFVSDYVRVKVLEEFGGLYLDTDFEILGDMHSILNEGINFVGFETSRQVGTAILAFRPHDSLIKSFLTHYQTHHFIDENGRVDNIANVSMLTDLLVKKGLKLNRSKQDVAGIRVYNREYFYPKRVGDNEFLITKETVGVHRCSNSWMTDKEKKRGNNIIWIKCCRPVLLSIKSVLTNIIGKEKTRKIEIKIRNILK